MSAFAGSGRVGELGRTYSARRVGTRSPKPRNILDAGMTLAGAVVIVASLGLCAFIYLSQKSASAVEAAFWSLQGQPCPTLDQAAYDRAWGTPQVTPYGGASFEYRVGHMMCTRRPGEGRDDGEARHPVCQFTGPVFLGVTTARGRYFFAPPNMSAARVGIIDGEARCVLIPRFRMNAHR